MQKFKTFYGIYITKTKYHTFLHSTIILIEIYIVNIIYDFVFSLQDLHLTPDDANTISKFRGKKVADGVTSATLLDDEMIKLPKRQLLR